jgi:hypothetical protein
LPFPLDWPAQATFIKGIPNNFPWSVLLTASSASDLLVYCTKAKEHLPVLYRIDTFSIVPNCLYSSLMSSSCTRSGSPPIQMRDSSLIVHR